MPVSDNPVYDFWEHQLNLLGEQDPLEVLAATPRRLAGFKADIEQWKRRPASDTWSPLEILTHLRDMEWVFGFRLRTILHDDRPRLIGVSQDDWNLDAASGIHDPRYAISQFEALRTVNLPLWKDLSPEQLQRVGVHDEADVEISLELLRRIQAGHDLSHLEQIAERL